MDVILRFVGAFGALSLLPGIPLGGIQARGNRTLGGWLVVTAAEGLLWSAVASFLLTVIHVPLTPVTLVLANLVPGGILARRKWRWQLWEILRSRTLNFSHLAGVVVVAALMIPLVTVQKHLPTGDIQKSIFWSNEVLVSRALPKYAEAVALNRDPQDFTTPVLHTLTAAVSALTGDSLRGPAWFSFFVAVVVAGLAGVMGGMLLPSITLAGPLAFLFAAMNMRFLRYTVAPGYHYQNLLGELFLILSVLALYRWAKEGGYRTALRGIISAAVTVGVHQFTAFLAAFLLPALGLMTVLLRRAEVARLLARRPRQLAIVGLLAGVGIVGGIVVLARSSFGSKLPHLFSSVPHLRPYLVSLTALPDFFGPTFVLLALAGALIVAIGLWRRSMDARWLLTFTWVGVILALSQGARWVIDIPSARMLLYLSTPAALFAACAVTLAVERTRLWWPRASLLWVPLALTGVLAATAGGAANVVLQNVDHLAQANSTLTPPTVELLTFLREHPPQCADERAEPAACTDTILVDDWNRRRLTWTILSPYHMVTRVGADLAVIAREASQSEQRQVQYQKLLDFEKIFDVGNSVEILPLLSRHHVAYIATANGLSDDIFSHNPALQRVYRNAETTLYAVRPEFRSADTGGAADHSSLLSAATMVNDIGDMEDSFVHLPVSILAPQLSNVVIQEGNTFRDVQSAVSTIGINIGTYAPQTWPAGSNSASDRTIRLQLRALGNGAAGRLTYGTTLLGSFRLPRDGALHDVVLFIPQSKLSLNQEGLVFLTLRLDQGPLRLDRVTVDLTSSVPAS